MFCSFFKLKNNPRIFHNVYLAGTLLTTDTFTFETESMSRFRNVIISPINSL